MSEKEMTVKDVMKGTRKTTARDCTFNFKTENFSVEVGAKYCRLDAKKILPFEEYEQTKDGVRVKGKLVGYNRGIKKYFPACQDEKGKWIVDEAFESLDETIEVEKVVMDTRTGLVAQKDTRKGLWFSKVVSADAMKDWHIEEVYNIWSEDNADTMLKVYDYLTEHNKVAVVKFNPYGTLYNGFIYPQRVDGGHFRLLMGVARMKINKPEIFPTMTISSAQIRAKERERLDEIGTMSAIEEV